jgi:hypothetical protein
MEVLVDGAEVLPRLAAELRRARSHVHVAGWHVSPHVRLEDGGTRTELKPLLAELAQRIDVRVLVWAGSPLPLFRPDRLAVREARRRLVAYVRAAFPGLSPEPVDGVLRLVTPLRGPDEDAFGLWQRDGVLAFAGHNLFKHAPSLGEMLAAAALGEAADPLLRPPQAATAAS